MKLNFDAVDDHKHLTVPASSSMIDLPSSLSTRCLKPLSPHAKLPLSSSSSYLSPFPSKQSDSTERGRTTVGSHNNLASRSRSLTRDALSFIRGRVKDAQRIHRNSERSVVRPGADSNSSSCRGSLFPLPSPAALFKRSSSVSPTQGDEKLSLPIAPWAKKGRMRSKSRVNVATNESIITGIGEKRKRRTSVEDEA